jgi:hypothetical protein
MKPLILIFVLLGVSFSLYSTIINVPGDQPTIQEGINVAVDGDTILVQPDTYFENIDYIGKNITVASLFLTTQDTIYISQTIIDGNNDGSVVTFVGEEDSTAVLIGFTITNGYSADIGGGINCYNSSPSLVNVTITGNSADVGGGVCFYNSSASLDNVSIADNSSVDWGGGINCVESSLSLVNVTITGNSAGDWGGGIHSMVSSSSLVNVTIIDNSAAGVGGGFYFWDSSPSLENVIISGNSASSGGGIACIDSNPILFDVTISNNEADSLGGGIGCAESNLSLDNVTITGNSADYDGGGLYSCYSNLQIENCDFTSNTAQDGFGGAIEYWNIGDPQYAGETYQVVISNTCFSNNMASGDGGVCIGKTNDDLTIINVAIEDCEFVDNFANSYGGLYLLYLPVMKQLVMLQVVVLLAIALEK